MTIGLIFSVFAVGYVTTTVARNSGNYALTKIILDGQELMWPLPVGQCVPQNLDPTSGSGYFKFTCPSGTPNLMTYTDPACGAGGSDVTNTLIAGNSKCSGMDTFATMEVTISVFKIPVPLAVDVCISVPQIQALNLVNFSAPFVGNNGSLFYNLQCNQTGGTVGVVPGYLEVFNVDAYTNPTCTPPVLILNDTGTSSLSFLSSLKLNNTVLTTLFNHATFGAIGALISDSSHCGFTGAPTPPAPTSAPSIPPPTTAPIPTPLGQAGRRTTLWAFFCSLFAVLALALV